jgi:hypothetical protein
VLLLLLLLLLLPMPLLVLRAASRCHSHVTSRFTGRMLRRSDVHPRTVGRRCAATRKIGRPNRTHALHGCDPAIKRPTAGRKRSRPVAALESVSDDDRRRQEARAVTSLTLH